MDVSFDTIYKMVVEQGFEVSIDELMKFAEDWGVENGNAYIVIGGERIDLGPITGGGSEESQYATVNELLAAISSGEYLLKKYNVESGGMVAFSSPFVMKVLKNVPAVLGGTARRLRTATPLHTISHKRWRSFTTLRGCWRRP